MTVIDLPTAFANAGTTLGANPNLVPPMLLDVLALVPKGDQGVLMPLLDAGLTAVQALAELDLSRYDEADEGNDTGGPYGLWERLAPIVAQTQAAVHALLEATQLTFSPTPAAGSPTARAQDAVRQSAEQIRAEIGRFGESLRRPEIMSDRWGLLQQIAAFRGRARALVGDMIFLAMGCFARVDRADLVPGAREEIQTSLQLRRAVAHLGRLVAAVDSAVQAATTEAERAENLGHVIHVLDDFVAGDAYRHVRTFDRRALLTLRNELRRARVDTSVDARQASKSLAEFMSFLGKINERADLQSHDRNVVEDAASRLHEAREALRSGILRARIETQSALRRLVELEGRNADLDRLITSLRPEELMSADLSTLLGRIEDLERVLGAVPR